MEVNEDRLNSFMGKMLGDVGAAMNALLCASTMVCTPASLDQEVGLALGAQAGEARLRDVAQQGDFARFRRVAEIPFNLILETSR